MTTLEIVVPCYNEADCISLLYEHLCSALEKESIRWSIILVNDGSRDKSLEKMIYLADKYGEDKVKYISLSRNFGKESALYAGLQNATADYVALMDADLQHPPELLPKMIAALDEGYDCCGARRVDRGGEPVIRSSMSKLFYSMINHVTSMTLVQGGSDYRMMKLPVVKAMVSLGERERFTKGIMSWVGFKTKWIDYNNVPRAAGKTKWSFRGLVKYAVNGFFAFATTPLRVAVWIGVLIDALTFVGAIWFIINTLSANGPRTGYGTLVILVSFFGGTIIMILGIIGEYLARIYLEVKKRPIYIIQNTNIPGACDEIMNHKEGKSLNNT